jgi:hypothetical protein
MGTRLEFQAVLEGLQNGLSVYFQPPDNIDMSFPAIIYNRDITSDKHADNILYGTTQRYSVMIIDRDPDSPIPGLVGALPYAKSIRHFTTAGLYHDIYYVYF